MKIPLHFLFAVCLVVPALVARGAESFDVVVYGATPSGVCAATATARAGVKVALVEPMSFVGGMMSSGLSFSDSNQCDRRTLGGLFEEVHRRIEADYRRRGVTLPYDVSMKDHRPWTYEPQVAERVFNEMLREAGVAVFLDHGLSSVRRRANGIEQVTAGKRDFAAHVFVDASYEGDLLAAAGVSYAVGRERKDQYGETLAGHQFPKPALAFSPRDAAGRLLPFMTGVAAAIAVQRRCSPHDVGAVELKQRLRAAGQVLDVSEAGVVPPTGRRGREALSRPRAEKSEEVFERGVSRKSA